MVSGQQFSFIIQSEDNGASFYCDADNWEANVKSRDVSFDVQCEFY